MAIVTDNSKSNWEDLRKEARYLENEIDVKLVSYSKVGANATFSIVNESDGDTTPLLSTGGDRMYESLSDEISHLLSRLTHVNDKMTEISSATAGLLSREAQHTLQRHRDILQDYSQEFKKTQSNLRSRREREELLQGVQREIDSSKTSINRRMDFYLKEHNHIKTSERLIDDQIAIAIETKENLANQRLTFKKIQTRMHDITSRFPALNNLISKINVKKRKDSIIIGIVIGACIFLLLMFAFR